MPNYGERVSLSAMKTILAQHGDEALLPTLEIEHHTFDHPIKFISDQIDLEDSVGNKYIAFPFEITFPNDLEEKIDTVQITIVNVDERLIPLLRGIEPPRPLVRTGVILRSDPDNPMVAPVQMEMQNVNYDAKSITLTLGPNFKINAKYLKDTMTPANCPGIF